MGITWLIAVVFGIVLYGGQAAVTNQETPKLKFSKEPPDSVEFVNTKGTQVECIATGTPDSPKVVWILSDGSPVSNIPDLRSLTADGKLIFHSFKPERFRPDVHSAAYRCIASNSAGTITTGDIIVKSVVLQEHDIQVYDTYAIEGSTAVFKCHIPSVMTSYLVVSAWIKNDNLLIQNTLDEGSNEKYDIMPTGDLHIHDVNLGESSSKYRCKALHRLTGTSKVSSNAGQLFITESRGTITPRILNTETSLSFSQGQTAALACIAQGNPVPTITWSEKKAGNRLAPVTIGGRFLQSKSALVIKNVRVEDEGMYVCEALNQMGREQLDIVLSVSDGLKATIEPSVFSAKLGGRVGFRCVVQGHPVSSLKWVHNGSPISDATSKDLIIQNAQLVDRGMYQCLVKNSESSTQATAELVFTEMPPQFSETFKEVILKPGNSFTLKCIVFGIPAPAITWKVDNTVFKNKDERVIITEKSGSDGRVESALNVRSAVTKDGGLYTCTSSNKVGEINHSARIFIYGTLGARTMQEMYAVSGGNIQLNCPVFGYPIGKIQWEKDLTPLPQMIHQKIFKNGTLTITEVNKVTDAGIYKCMTSNDDSKVTAEIRVEVFVPPKVVPFEFQDELLREGMRARLQCVVSEGDLPLSVTWLKDGKPIPPELGVVVRVLDEFSSILTIASITPGHNGKYTCAASNQAATVTHSAELSVNVPPRWVIKPKNTATVKGEDIILHCQVIGFPVPQITWMFSKESTDDAVGKQLSGGNNIQLFPNGTLMIVNINQNDEGAYYCLASNGIGHRLSSVANVKINAPPIFREAKENFISSIGSHIQLKCIIEGDSPMSVLWHKNENSLQSNDKSGRYKILTSMANPIVTSVLTVSNISKDDDGTFICSAKNKFGSNKMNILLKVIGVPETPLDLKVISTSSRTTELQWRSPFDGNDAIRKFLIQYKTADESWDQAVTMETVNGEPTNSVISQLHPATHYMFRLLAENSQGKSTPSRTVHVTTTEDAPSGSPEKVQVESVNTETVRVMWQSPNEKFWNGKLQGFYVGYKEVDTEDPYLFKTLLTQNPKADDLYVQIGGLKQFTKYAVIVQAYNSEGKGPESEPVIIMTSEGAPSLAPTEVRCTTLTSKSVHLTWTAPTSDSINGILRGYKVLYKPASDGFEDLAESFNVTLPPSLTLNNLEKFANYSVQVLAMTRAGEGPRSNTIFCKTLDDVPGPPIDIKAIATSDDSVVVAWKPPERPNGVIRSYTVYWKDQDSSKGAASHTVSVRDHSYEATGLKKGQRYEFWVTASTMAGQGSPSRTVFETPNGPTVAARVISFDEKVITAWKSEVILTCHSVGLPQPEKQWMFNGKRLEISDKARLSEDDTLTLVGVQEEDAGDYSCQVQNDFGQDRVTYTILILAPPSAPVVEVTAITSSAIDLQWKVPASKMSRIKGYVLQLRTGAEKWREVTVGPDARSYHLNSLVCGNQYEIYMTAFNKIGVGAPSETIMITTNGSVPLAPTKSDLVEETSNSVSLYLNTWKSNGCPIIYYTVEYASKLSNQWTVLSNNIKPEQRRLVIPGLKSGTWYGLRMTAFNSAGSSVAEYSFATLTSAGATIPPDLLSDAGSNPVESILAYFNFYVVVPITCTIIMLLAILAVACFYVKAKGRGNDNANQVGVSDLMKRGNSTESFSYMQRGTLNKAASSSKRAGDEVAPYATLHLRNQNRGSTGGPKGFAPPDLPPPLPPPRMSEFLPSHPEMVNPHFQPAMCGGFAPMQNTCETTFIFPNMQGHGGMMNFPPSGYPNIRP